IAVGVVGMVAENADMTVVLEPAHHPVVRNVAPDEISPIAEIDGPLGPAEAGGDAVDAGIALLGDDLVKLLDPRIGIAGPRQGSQRQIASLWSHHRLLPVTRAPFGAACDAIRPAASYRRHHAGREGYTIPA